MTSYKSPKILIKIRETKIKLNKQRHKKLPIHYTFITGSCILKGIETKFLDRNVRIKTFRDTTTENLHESLVEMYLSRYKHIIIHVGGHDIDKDISRDSFKEKYQSLLDFLKTVGSKPFVAGLLPRGGTDMKIFNMILKICVWKIMLNF